MWVREGKCECLCERVCDYECECVYEALARQLARAVEDAEGRVAAQLRSCDHQFDKWILPVS